MTAFTDIKMRLKMRLASSSLNTFLNYLGIALAMVCLPFFVFVEEELPAYLSGRANRGMAAWQRRHAPIVSSGAIVFLDLAGIFLMANGVWWVGMILLAPHLVCITSALMFFAVANALTGGMLRD